MNLNRLLLILTTAYIYAQPIVSRAADVSERVYRYSFELTEGRSCDGSSKLRPEEINRALAQATTTGGFLQLDHYRTASGTEAAVGFVNPRYIVRFYLVSDSKPEQP
jgi:hypothetical protein